MSLRTKHPLYATWTNMRQRTRNPSCKYYRWYGARGIGMCDRWYDDFRAFCSDMEALPGYGRGLSIDRIDNDIGYQPGNVRWGTRTQQARNTRANTLITHEGETLSLAEWSERTGISPSTLIQRMGKLGWSVAEALSRPLRGAA